MTKKIILVHGLGGTADGTWGKFPDFLEGDTDIDFITLQYAYESPHILKQFWARAPSILNIANGLITDIVARCDLDKDEIILAGHSLGGLVIKQALIQMGRKKILHNIKKICFFDVPHDGSGFANIGKYISFRNRHLRSLCRDSGELDDLNDQWVDSGLDNVLDILSIVAANDGIVSSLSSKSIFRHHQVETINNVDHITIVKPKSLESSSYIVFKKFILKKNTINRYKNRASRDIRDWKSVDRNHSYHYAFDEDRKNDLESLVSAFESKQAVIRLTGASGLGKTRLILESIDASHSIDDSCVLIFNATSHEAEIKDSVRAMVEGHVHGLVIIENCSVDLHNHLVKEINKTECALKLVTVGYSDNQVDDSIHIKLSPLSDEAIKQLLSPILIGMNSSDLDRVARFAQGYPLMATLIAEQYRKEGRLLGAIETQSVVTKLIDGGGGISDDERQVLCACALFDVFGTSEGTAGEEAKFIAEEVAGANLKVFERVIKLFTGRQIINRAGRYARVVPKPLALTLAAEWWQETSYERQKKLVDTLPDSLMHSFCIQASYLDHQQSVQRFSDRLFGGQSPFVQAEELITERGSRLFRAFVEVNPESTSNALYHVLYKLSHKQLLNLDRDVRRNLVWGLEKLCFRADVFETAAWCMLLLASAETENFSNNATGMFAQLFRVNLSGTQAKPSIRFDLLQRAIDANQPYFDMVILKALKQAISTYGGTRTIGAEYQGTQAELKEWRPELWQEVFDFWQQAFNMLLVLFEKGEAQKEAVLSIVGQSIRGFVARHRLEMLDGAIRKIVSINGCYWPAALEDIDDAFKYESNGMKQEVADTLNSWLELLSPNEANLPDRLKILITNPPWQHEQSEDGHYIDMAAEKAKALASELANNPEDLIPHIGLLLDGEQKQSYAFGYQLGHDLTDLEPILISAFANLSALKRPDSRLILGLYRSMFEKSPTLWQKNIDRLVADERLVHLYPDFIRTGDIQKYHLDTLLNLVQRGTLSPNCANGLSYGSVTKGIEPTVIIDFCIQLAELGEKASWSALNVIYMYCFGNWEHLGGLREQLKYLVTVVPLHKGHDGTDTDLHHWHDMATKLLKISDREFAISLTRQLITASKNELDHGDIWSYAKPLLIDLMSEYSDTLWPIFGEAITEAKGIEKYWLQQLLDRENGIGDEKPSVLSVVPVARIIDWCSDSPEERVVFVAACLNVFETVNGKRQPSPLFVALLEKYGGDLNVTNQLSANMGSKTWIGSVVPYLKSDKESLHPLLSHNAINVRRWAKDYIAYLDQQIKHESERDEEQHLGFY
jgi:hypothetical protein